MGNPLIPLCPCKAFVTDDLLSRWNENENEDGDGNGNESGIRMGMAIGIRSRVE